MRCFSALLAISGLLLQRPVGAQEASTTNLPPQTAITMLVADPLCKELACDCVSGYAQRRYEALAMVLESRLKQPVNSLCGTDLATYWDKEKPVSLIIGKHSDVLYQAKALGRKIYPIASLTDQNAKTTFQGLFVVRKGNAAKTLKDLQGYRVIYGPPSNDEKHSAAVEALAEAGIKTADGSDRETAASCTDAANELMKLQDGDPAVAVISDYAKVLLEGCQAIPPGSLRVIGKTKSLPFISVFATEELSPEMRRKVQKELVAAKRFKELLKWLESKEGFEPLTTVDDTAAVGWTDFRGAHRDGLVAKLPDTLDLMRELWTAPLAGSGLGGVAVTDRWVLATDRVEDTRTNYLKMFDIQNGALRFTGDLIEPTGFLANKNLDYGNSIRTTPVVVDQRVFLLDPLGAFFTWQLPDANIFAPTDCITGTSTALLIDDFEQITWGVSSTPLVIHNRSGSLRVVLNTCGSETSLLYVDPDSLAIHWKGPGNSSGYATCIQGTFGGRRQIVGYDQVSLGGWDLETGERIWTVTPEVKGDFNVPTPVALDDQRLLVVTESNGMRIYRFDAHGVLQSQPTAVNEDVMNDTVSPVVSGGHAYCTSDGALFQVSATTLETQWTMDDKAFAEHVSLIADRAGSRLLVSTYRGELLLFDTSSATPELVSRRRIFIGSDEEIYSHPSLVGNRLYVRGLRSLKCLQL